MSEIIDDDFIIYLMLKSADAYIKHEHDIQLSDVNYILTAM